MTGECAMNQGELDVDRRIFLTASIHTMKARIAGRSNPFGKDEATGQKILADKDAIEPLLQAKCDLVINTDQPLYETVRQIRPLPEV